ncbi:MAG: AMP-binding enzyme family protein [Rhizobacter sp.]|nr:AMP-binding enzyme family protein [Rhizobacter sp.]
MTTSYYDELETRTPAEREAALMAALPKQVAHAQASAPAFAESLRGVDAASITSRQALSALPVIRKHELVERQKAARGVASSLATPPAGVAASAVSTPQASFAASSVTAGQTDGAAAAHGLPAGSEGEPGASRGTNDTSAIFGGFAAIGWGAQRGALRVFASPGPIYEPEGHAPDYWRVARAIHAAGFRSGDLVHNSFSYHFTPAGSIMETGAHALGCTVFPAGVGQTEQQVQAMADLKPAGYIGTPSFLKIILEKAAELGVALPSVQRALVSGEACPPSLQAWFTAHGVAALQCYATADLGLIAYETEAHEGLVLDEGVIVEIVRPGTGEPLPDGEVGELVVTTLNPDYPLIRFGTGDLSAVMPGPCPTGRTNVRIRGWMGRADQTAKVRGLFVHPSQVSAILARHPELGRARLWVGGEVGVDRMVLQAEIADPPAALAFAVEQTLREVTRLRGEVEWVAVGSLPNDGRVIVDERKLD